MFGFGKKSDQPATAPVKKQKKVVAVEYNPSIAAKIHVMPQRFYVVPKKKNIWPAVVVTAAIVVVGGISIGVYFLLSRPSGTAVINQSEINSTTNANQPATNAAGLNTNGAVNLNRNTGATATATTPIANVNINQNSGSATNVNTNGSVNVNVNTAQPPANAPDIDGDRLTSAEEILFSTNPNNPDSDGDSYLDGTEIINGFDPTRPALTLAESGLFKTYNTTSYTIIYPGKWTARASGNDVVFQSTTGELVKVTKASNPQKLALADWYQQQFPTSVNSNTSVTINGLTGLRSADRLSYYLVSPQNLESVYIITYDVGSREQVNFVTTFNVMVSNFNLVR